MATLAVETGEPGRKAKGIKQYRIIFGSSWSHFAGTARPPGSGSSSSFGRGFLLRRPWPTLRPRHGEVLNWRQYSELSRSWKARKSKMADPKGKGCEIGERTAQRHQSVERADHGRAVGLQQWFCLARRSKSPVPVPCNLNHPTRREGKPRAGRGALIWAKGRRVGAAQVPAHTHRVPALASSPCANSLNKCKRASRRKAHKDRRPG